MPNDTGIGGPRDAFPATRWSAVLATRSNDEAERTRSLEVLISAYWKPVYKYIRLKWDRSNEDAKDLTQGFFLKAMEKDYFRPYDPAKAKFRTFLRTCVDGYVANQDKAAHAQKRGGDAAILPLDFEGAESEISAGENGPIDEVFDREWVSSLFGISLEILRQECEAKNKSVNFRLFEKYDLEDAGAGRVTYDDLAREFRLPVTTITNHLAWVRREFRKVVLDKLREITATDEEFRSEARAVLGIEA